METFLKQVQHYYPFIIKQLHYAFISLQHALSKYTMPYMKMISTFLEARKDNIMAFTDMKHKLEILPE